MLVYLTSEERRDLARRYRLAYQDADVTFLHQASLNGNAAILRLDDVVRFRKRTREVTEDGVVGLLVSMTDERGQRGTFAVILLADDQTGRRQYRVPLGDVTHVSS